MQGEEGGLLSPTSRQKPLTLQVIISLPLSLFLTFIHKSFLAKGNFVDILQTIE